MAPQERALLDLLKEVEDKLPRADFLEVEDLAKHNEWGVGFEFLCTQLFEYDIRLPRPLVSRFAALGNEMGIDPHYWEGLEEDGNGSSGKE